MSYREGRSVSSGSVYDGTSFSSHSNSQTAQSEIPSSYAFPSIDGHYHSWEQHSSLFPTISSRIAGPNQSSLPSMTQRAARNSSYVTGSGSFVNPFVVGHGAMISNISFTYRSIYFKKPMTGMDSTNVYAYISIIALLFCLPPEILIEGPKLMQYGFQDAIAKVGLYKFLSDLFWIGMFYHLYNQVATNTLKRVAPLTHAVGNVLK
ncbi:hypothetical protein POM88_001788 [Heracleum sosnowskyi]|uniref:Sugar phosphate transporter domain-containing protein n=1 Tax=Heracleum sosnowskyi TaxID=360622 RepID=A0AAD8NC05_9APIA|nr:hypothetical protein POM88_001788 [Heracleum sosnowskyi]